MDSGLNMSSSVSEIGDESIAVETIDNLVGNERVNLIKMDIEGSELRALNGAVSTIRNQRPALAICVYHRPEDLMLIPQFIKTVNRSYRIYLRYHKLGVMSLTDLVLYAVP